MKPRTLAVLAGLVLALGAFVWFFERELPGSEEREELASRVIPEEADEITALEWTAGADTIRLERAGDEWALAKPLSTPADSTAAQRIVDTLTGLTKERVIEDATAEEVGLVDPEGEIVVELDGGRRRSYLAGPRLPASEWRILSPSLQGPVWVVANDFWQELERPVGDWRSRDVWTGSAPDVDRISISRGVGTVVFERRDGEFWLVEPIDDRADAGTVSRLLGSLAALEATDFVDPPDADADGLGLGSDSPVIELIDGDASVWRLEIGGPADEPDAADGESENATGRYLRANDQVYVAADSLGEALSRPLAEWRSLEWATLEVFEIQRLIIEQSGERIELERQDGDWLRDGAAIEFAPASDLLYAVTGGKGEALDAEPGEEPLLAITLESGEGAERLEVYPAVDDRHPARTSRREALLWLGDDMVRDLLSKLDAVRDAPLLELEQPAESAAEATENEE